jgi:glycosyltransferase involved in cell wall biosynthesis
VTVGVRDTRGVEERVVSATEHDVSVVICVYTEERWDDIVAAVESVRRQTIPALETVIVVDHNPTLLDRVRRGLPDVVAIENTQPRGLSGARNCGIAVARGDLIAFLDDDAVAAPDWLAWLTQALADPSVLGAGGHVEPAWVEARPAWFPQEFQWTVGCSYRGLPRSTTRVRNPFGGCTCTRRAVFEGVGGFRSEIGRVGKRPLGCEETELSIRAHQRWPFGTFLYEPRAKIRHRVPPERTRFSYFRARCYAEGLSKARVARLVGSRDGLASERSYTLFTLPTGVLAGLRDTVVRGDRSGLARAGAIVAGFAFTTAGYVMETLSEILSAAPVTPSTPAPAIDQRQLPSDIPTELPAQTPPALALAVDAR